MWSTLLHELEKGDVRALARAVSCVENEVEGYETFLSQIRPNTQIKLIGVTGPPGAGKSTLTDALIQEYTSKAMRVAVLCVDPSSPFSRGAILGDRIRMNRWYNHSSVYIRSLASRGSLGGLSPKMIEITELLRSFNFDIIIIETVGVGQSEVEIASLADLTLVVLVPEAGDEVQAMKSGLMEVADIFVVNKADRPGSDEFARNLRLMLPGPRHAEHHVPVLKTVASNNEGIGDLVRTIDEEVARTLNNGKKIELLADKAYQLIVKRRMGDINREALKKQISQQFQSGFNLYQFVDEFYS